MAEPYWNTYEDYIELRKKVTLFLTMLDKEKKGHLVDGSFGMVKVIEELKILTDYERLTPSK